jgi:hypothetical protein
VDRGVSKLDIIDNLLGMGILGNEDTGDPEYWSWKVLKPDQLPDSFIQEYLNWGEIRYYLLENK